jgi:RimJ/RimL family protein N-acetyltransferase
MGPPWNPRGYRPSARDFTHACRHLTVFRARGEGKDGSPWFWIVNRETGGIEGFLMVRRHKTVAWCQIYYALRPSARGQGFATEALAMIRNRLVLEGGVEGVFLRGDINNVASREVAIRAGFQVIKHKAQGERMYQSCSPRSRCWLDA